MKSMRLFTLLVLACGLVFTSCKEKAAEDTTTTTTEANTSATPTSEVMPTAEGTEASAEPVGPTTTMAFDEMEYNWGKVMDGDKVTKVFKFKNTGNEPLTIKNAKGSCGCTVPDWPKDPIAPGKSGEIKVVYDSKGKGAVGGKQDTKKVTITANTDPVDSYLTITGIVDKKEEAPAAN